MKIANKIRLLIVEDDPVQTEILVDKLIEYNKDFQIEHFVSGELLIEYLNNHKNAYKKYYLILDYFIQNEGNKDGLNGLGVINYLANKYQDIKIVLFSAYESDDDLKFDTLIDDHSNLIGVIKKAEYAFNTLQNIIRFDFIKGMLQIKRKRYIVTRIIFIVFGLFTLLYFIFNTLLA